MKSSVRETLIDAPASESAHAVAPALRTGVGSAAPVTALAGGNAAIQRMVSGHGPHSAPPGLLAAGGNRALHRLHSPTIQPKLSVSQPGDRFERQADAVAAQVSLGEVPVGPAPTVSRLVAPGAAAGDQGPPGLEALLANPGSGVAIPADIRAQIEPHLGVDLANVVVHSDSAAQAAAAQLGARAFTAGGHIFLGAGESAADVSLMAHEATHVVQQQTVGVYRLQRESDSFLPDFIMDEVRDLAHAVPGYTMLTVVAGYDPIANRTVDRSPQSLVRGVMGLVPFGSNVAGKLLELGVLQDAFRIIDAGLMAHNLTLERIQREIDQAWNELSISNGIDGNIAVINRYVSGLYNDALAFVSGILDEIVQLIRDAAVGLAENYLEGMPLWELTKKVLHYDPLRGTSIDAPTVEILADFLTLIGKHQALAQMRERGTLQQTADWLDAQIPRFLSLIGDFVALFGQAWRAIQPANVANLSDNLTTLAHDAITLTIKVGAFADEVVTTVLKIIKYALLDWLSREASGLRGFRLMTVILGQNPFDGKPVQRTPENLIGGFIALLPGGEATYQQLAEAGVIADAGAQIEAALGRLGFSTESITSTFLSIWDSLTLEDLLNPIAAFTRILDKLAEPLGRIVAFVGEVMKVVITLILKLMNFPPELLGNIISNAMAAIDDIQRDPVGFLLNMIAALKSGFSNFLDNVLGYLMTGLSDWLFRGLGAKGIQKPSDLSFTSILEMVLQVLDITADKLWTKLGKKLGADVVQKVRNGLDMADDAYEFVVDLRDNGVAAIWKHVESQLGDLWDRLLGMAQDWIVTTIIEKAAAKLLSMLDPTGIMAVVNSGIAFFNAVQSVIEYVREILAIVNDYVGTLAAVAAGNISAGAAKVERGLANSIPVAIGFLANQAGLDNVPDKLVELIGQLRELVDAALDWVFEQAKKAYHATLSAFDVGGESAPAASGPATVTGAAPEPDPINEPVSLDGDRHHLRDDGPGGALALHSETVLVNTIAHADLQALLAAYNAAAAGYEAHVKAHSTPTGADRTESRLRLARHRAAAAIAQWIGANNPLGAGPGGSAPELGQVQPHGKKPSSMAESGSPLWILQSEHVVPFAVVRKLWTVIGTHSDEVTDRGKFGAEDDALPTIMIYKGAADEKNRLERDRRDGLAGELGRIGRDYWARPEAGRDPAAEQRMRELLVKTLLNEKTDYVALTSQVVHAEFKQNGAQRNEASALPTIDKIDKAATLELAVAEAILDKALAELKRPT